MATLLRAHKARQNTERLRAGGAYRDHGLVFVSAGGAPLVHANLWRSFKGLMKRLGLPAASPHTCRHTVATNLLYAGVPLNEVSHLLGHAGVEVTARVYAHALVRGGASAWTPPPGLRGLDLLEAWYARARTGAGDAGDAGDAGGADGRGGVAAER
jgi:integrase